MSREPDPADVLQFAKDEGLVDAACTVEQLPPPVFRLYADVQRTQTAVAELQRRQEEKDARWWEQAKRNRAAHQAREDRKNRIREWAAERGRSTRMSSGLIEAFEIDQEGRNGQTALF